MENPSSLPHWRSVTCAGRKAESRGEVYSCANDRFQSGRIFNEMVALIQRHPALSVRTNITSFRKKFTI